MIPTALYIHIPWCIKKCPYCDFNSHKSPDALPEQAYIQALLDDLDNDLAIHRAPEIHSIFIGGGTPSLISAAGYAELFTQLKRRLVFTKGIEITLEANPGTVEQSRFKGYHEAGINRLSLGIQSFNANHLKQLGRIHDDSQARRAVENARASGFDNINLDIMHGLPHQTTEEALNDLHEALAFEPEHLSWYQLTLEPNTVFFKKPPRLPDEDVCADIEEKGLALLAQKGYERYEISAFCKPSFQSQHNLNYWRFGDYYGIGAGAHGKLTLSTKDSNIMRTQKMRMPQDYLDPNKPFCCPNEYPSTANLCFEWMLNVSRLQEPIALSLFTKRTGLTHDWLLPNLHKAKEKGLITFDGQFFQITAFGRRFTNSLQELFLPAV